MITRRRTLCNSLAVVCSLICNSTVCLAFQLTTTRRVGIQPSVHADGLSLLKRGVVPLSLVPQQVHVVNIKRSMTAAQSQPEPPSNDTTKSITQHIFNTIGASTSLVVSGTFFAALAYYRDALMVSFFIGSIGNAILGKVLKRILNQERPAELDTVEMKLKPSDMGMPSSHAMSLGFIGTFTALCIGIPVIQWIILFYSLVSLWYRIDSKLHTWQQIAVGFVLGSANGGIWQWLCQDNNISGFSVTELVRQYLMNDQGVLPWTLLIVPALVGAIVVGSIERRLAGWLKRPQKQKMDAAKDE
jgi:membrane-associated phospholipid phosphatase